MKGDPHEASEAAPWVTISCGVVTVSEWGQKPDLERMFLEADRALYRAKQQGRNGVCSV